MIITDPQISSQQ